MKNERNTEFKFLEIPNGEDVLALLGSEGILEYGVDENGKRIEKNHFHNLMEIGICRWGTGEIVFDQKRYPYRKGDVTVIPQNYPHRVHSLGGEKSFWEYIYIKPAVFLEKVCKGEMRKRNRYREEAEYRPFIKRREDGACLTAEIDLIMDQFRVRDYGYRDCVKGLVFALLMEIVKLNHIDNEKPEFDTQRQRGKVGEFFEPGHLDRLEFKEKYNNLSLAMKYIEENYERELRIQDIAQAAFVSETYLRRLFAECCAISPMQYVKMIRIDAACKLIKNTNANMNEIAYNVGFENMATFINNFKKSVGCTPKQWKKKMSGISEKKGSEETVCAKNAE